MVWHIQIKAGKKRQRYNSKNKTPTTKMGHAARTSKRSLQRNQQTVCRWNCAPRGVILLDRSFLIVFTKLPPIKVEVDSLFVLWFGQAVIRFDLVWFCRRCLWARCAHAHRTELNRKSVLHSVAVNVYKVVCTIACNANDWLKLKQLLILL